MSQASKTETIFKVELRETPPVNYMEEAMQPDLKTIVKQAGGEIGVALFEGKFRDELQSWMWFIYAKGRYDYHKQLLAKSKKVKRKVK